MGCINYQTISNSPIIILPLQKSILHPKIPLSQTKQQKINIHRRFSKQLFTENIIKITNKTQQYSRDRNFLEKILQTHFFFYKLSSVQRQNIIKKMILCAAQAGNYVFKQKDPPNGFFIIVQGSLIVEINQKTQRKLKRGDYFGDLALINSALRSASIYVEQKSKFWCLTKNIFKKTVEDMMKNNYRIAKKYINTISIFTFLTQQQKNSITYAMFPLKYENKHIIFKELDDANSFYVIIKGSVQISIKGKNNILLNTGQSFGQQSFAQNQFRGGTAIARGQTVCLSISRQTIKNILGNKIKDIIYYNMTKWIIKRSKLLSQLSNIEIEKLLENRKYIIFKDRDVIHYGIDPDIIIIGLEGSINSISCPCIIGEDNFMKKDKQQIEQKIDFIQNGDGIVTIIKEQQIKALLINKDRKIGQLKAAMRGSFSVWYEDNYKLIQDLRIQNLLSVGKLGQGQFGTVYLVKEGSDDRFYAVKCISKDKIVQNRIQKLIIQQRKILSKVKCPYIIKFYKSFKDKHYIYFVTQYIKGIQLYDLIQKNRILQKNISRFYIAIIILCIQYLHSKKIIYRDLKPQNIIIQPDGYLKLIDMGTAKQLKNFSGFRTYTLIGTPHYMAPEIMQARGYTYSADIWSIGIILYQFIYGKLPFGQNLSDPYQIHHDIMKSQLKFPQSVVDCKVKKLLNQMMSKLPQLRLPKGFDSIKAQSYFDGFQWQLLDNKKMKSPFKPQIEQISCSLIKNASNLVNKLTNQKIKIINPRKSILSDWDSQF